MTVIDGEAVSLLLEGKAIVADWPWGEGNERAVDDFFRRLLAEAERVGRLRVEAEFRHYGSGYASYVDVFAYPADDSTRIESAVDHHYKGLVVLLSRLSPYYCMGYGEKGWKADRSGFSYLPSFNMLRDLDDPRLDGAVQAFRDVLSSNGMRELTKADMAGLLPADVRVPTILADPPFRVFDAIFHWED